MITPKQFAKHMHDLGQNIPGYAIPENEVKEFIDSASSAELQEGIMLALKTRTIWNMSLLDASLDKLKIRLQIETAQAAEKHLKQVEQLNALTSTHIDHTKTLTNQTDILIIESKRLSNLTMWIIGLTWGLFGLTVMLFIRDLCKEKTEVITNPVTVTNVPAFFVITNTPINVVVTNMTILIQTNHLQNGYSTNNP